MFVPIITGLMLSGVIEQLHTPRPNPLWLRRPAYVLMHCGLWLILFLIEFIQFRRPWLAMSLTNTIFYVLILINHTKYRFLREPFIFQDFDYFIDALRHPRLYLPFFGFWKIALCLMIVGFALWTGVSLETPLTKIYSTTSILVICVLVLAFVIVLITIGHSSQSSLSFKPDKDFKKFGLLTLFWKYYWAEKRSAITDDIAQYSSLLNEYSLSHSKKYIHTIVIQSESFFDPRRAFSGIKSDVLAAFDQACQESVRFGQLEVPAWGANTVRTEFEFLTGNDSTVLGIDQFNPYRRAALLEIPSIAKIYKKLGYRTICIHPYPSSFYQREIVFPILGFDEFIDIQSFQSDISENQQCPYVSDQILTDKVIEVLNQNAEQALFIYVITMENHGPLHLEHISHEDAQTWITNPLTSKNKDPSLSDTAALTGNKELPIYLRHLSNADQMISRLITYLSAFSGGSLTEKSNGYLNSTSSMKNTLSTINATQLLWYGDHVPVMPAVYEKIGLPDGQTDYFLWRSDAVVPESDRSVETHSLYSYKNLPIKVSAHQLASELLKGC